MDITAPVYICVPTVEMAISDTVYNIDYTIKVALTDTIFDSFPTRNIATIFRSVSTVDVCYYWHCIQYLVFPWWRWLLLALYTLVFPWRSWLLLAPYSVVFPRWNGYYLRYIEKCSHG